MTADASRAILPEPPDDLKRHSQALSALIRERIREAGPMPFAEYMEMALYQPGLGYYSAGLQKFGAGGDFVTAPELGELFGGCLARQGEEIFATLGHRDLLEIGAGSGRLAGQLLQRLSRPGMRYRILERSAHLRQAQAETIAAMAPHALDCVEWLDTPPAEPWQGLILANEVIDALPVERFQINEGAVDQLFVVADGEGFDWQPGPARAALREEVDARLGETMPGLPEGYRSELCLSLAPWLAAVTSSLERGCALFIDYGYPRREYYLPQRRDGTLICHYRHRAVDAPFRWPGLQDITAFVDFTALAEAGLACGLDLLGYTSQAMFLLGSGLDGELAGLAELPPERQLRLGAEARQLTLPGEMGEKFQAMALGRGLDANLRGFALMDLGHRL